MKRPLVSFIIPLYNCEKYIERCINSITDGLYLASIEGEIIIVDDGSTDRGREIATGLIKDNRNIRLFSQRNKGASAARNAGLCVALGDYVWFIDADDRINSQALPLIIEELKNDKKSVVIFGNTFESKQVANCCNKDYHVQSIDPLSYLHNEKRLYLWNKIYSREAIGQLRFLDGIKNIEDYLFNIEFFTNVKDAVQLDVNGYCYNDTNALSTSRSKSLRNLVKISQDSFTVHRRLLSIFNESPEGDKVIVKEMLDFSVSGHLFSLAKFYNFRRFCNAIRTYRELKIFPIELEKNLKLSAWLLFINMFARLLP